MTLVARSKFDEIAIRSELEQWRPQFPDRTAQFITESPSVAALDDGDYEAYQKRQLEEQLRRAEIQKVAAESGVPAHFLHALSHRPTQLRIDPTRHDEQHARAFQLGLDEEMMRVDNAVRAQQNVANVAQQARAEMERAHLQNPIHEFETQFFDLTDDEGSDSDIPIYRPNLHTPQVPLGGRISWADVANTALQTTGSLANAGAQGAYATGAIVQAGASAMGTVAPPLAMGLASAAPVAGRALVGSARLGGRAAIGSARLTSVAARNLASALGGLVQAGMHVNHRGEDFMSRRGVRATDMISAHRW